MRALLSCLACATAVLLNVGATAQDAAPADRNAINTRARPGGMSGDSPVTFPKEGALPTRHPPDLKEQVEPSEKDYFIFSSPCRSLAQIAAIQKEMPAGQFTSPPADWTYLRRTRRILLEGGDLRLLGLGDSIVNDTMRSGWVAKLQEAYPKARIQARVFVRGGGGCQHYREEARVAKYILPWRPDLVYIGGISQKDLASIREVIRQLRAGLPDVEILLATGTFGTADPRDPAALATASHSGTGAYGQALKSLAAEEHCACLDMTGPWAEYIRSSRLHPHLFYRDVVHANEYGEQILAKIMMAFWTAPDPRVAARGIAFPQDESVLDVRRDFGARGDGVADDTDALQNGIEASSGGKGAPSKVLFIPNGTYRVTRTLVVKSGVGPWVYGESRDGVIIRLADGMPTNVTAALRTHPSDTVASSADFFMRNFRNLTIDVGNNPTVDGVRWYGNNSSILKDVRVIGNGRVGINAGFLGQNGPNLVQDALVEGLFETGVRCAWSWGQTLSRVTVRKASAVGVYVNATSVGIEGLVVEDTPVALHNEYPNDWPWWGGVVALVGGRFNGGDPAHPAITNTSVLYARDVQATGFKQVLSSATSGGSVAGDTLGEYLSHPVRKLFPETPETALRLPVKTEPRVAWETSVANWVCANDHGAKFGDNQDDTAAIQAAIDAAAAAGKTVVYLRGIGGGDPNWYTVDGEVRVHGSVRMIIGLGFGRVIGGDKGRFIVDDRSAPVVKFLHLKAFGGPPPAVENRSATNVLVVESCDLRVVGSGGGDIFVTDCPSRVELRSPGQPLWARQLNPEGDSDTGLVQNHGGRLWALGVKHEGRGVRFLTDRGGQTEILGLFNYAPDIAKDDPRPAFDVVDADFSAAGVREISFGNTYPVKAREHRGEAVRTEMGGGWIGWALFRSGTDNPAPAVRPAAKLNTAFPLRVSESRRHLVEQNGTPFFIMGDTPWFIQKLALEDVRMLMDDRVSKGFNTLFLELLDDSRIPSVDGYGNAAFQTDTDLTRPLEAYWKYAEQVVEEAEQRGLFVIHSELWYGAGGGLWMHHVTPENAKLYGAFIGRRFARFKNLMWMHAGDRNPDPSLAACTRILAREIQAAAPHHLHTVHNAHEFASARFHHEDRWLDVNLGYTYGAASLHILPEYQRSGPVRPVILGETGYEAEPNAIELLPDARQGDLWTPFRIRRNAWWAALSGASGYCAGTRLWRWEPDWRETMQVRSTREAPNLRRGLSVIAWWKLVPDTQHQFVTAGYGEWTKADYATAAVANDGSCAVVYLPTPRTFTADLAKLNGPVTARWFDPAGGQFQDVPGLPSASSGNCAFAPPSKNAAGESDWVLVLGSP